MLLHVPLGDLANVFAVIPPLGNLLGVAAHLPDAGLHAASEVHDLGARVVVVELARHLPPRPREQRRDRIAERCLAAMADMQGAGGIGGNELDIGGAAPARLSSARPRGRPAPWLREVDATALRRRW